MFETDAQSALWGLSPTFLIVGGIYHIISIAAPHWMANSTVHMGLWTHCQNDGECVGITERLNANDNSWYRTVQGVEVVATVFVLAGLVTGLMRVNLGHRIWQIASGTSAILAGMLGVSGVIVYGTNYAAFQGQVLSWAFMFNAASSSMCLLAGPVLVLDSLVNRS